MRRIIGRVWGQTGWVNLAVCGAILVGWQRSWASVAIVAVGLTVSAVHLYRSTDWEAHELWERWPAVKAEMDELAEACREVGRQFDEASDPVTRRVLVEWMHDLSARHDELLAPFREAGR